MITIVDYGLGNLASIKNMIKKVGGIAEITSDLNKISNADKIILPGVGAFAKGMENLISSGIKPVLDRKALHDKVPVMGICLGMQLLTKHSEEGNVNGLGWINATTKKFTFDTSVYKIPHMGWTDIKITQPSHPIFENLISQPRYYFVHSYFVTCEQRLNSLAEATYGTTFDCGIVNDNIFGFQFHPEKSHRFGMEIMRNFIHNF
jgi:imidazole glycerol-phosphate synthase subunit HisH